jgi:anti-anti-sigma regulatory factor
MRGHGDDDRRHGGGPALQTVPVTSTEEARDDAVSDLIFDFSELEGLDLKGLAMLLTAQQVADRNAQTVWLAGLPRRVWKVFRAMGLDEYFREFPGREDPRS